MLQSKTRRFGGSTQPGGATSGPACSVPSDDGIHFDDTPSSDADSVNMDDSDFNDCENIASQCSDVTAASTEGTVCAPEWKWCPSENVFLLNCNLHNIETELPSH